jgi:hypothetical protein
MRKILPLVLAAVVGVGTTLTLVAPAEAAASVSIKPIADRFAAPGKTTTIKPVYTKAKNVKVTSARLTVKLGKKTVATSKASVAVKAAADPKTYAITTVVKYKVKKNGTYGATKTATKKSAMNLFACGTSSAVAAIVLSDEPGKGQLASSVGAKLGNPQSGGGLTLGEAYEAAAAEEDVDRQAEIEGLYGKGWVSTDSLVQLGYLVCGKKATEPSFTVLEYLMQGESEPRAYQFLG